MDIKHFFVALLMIGLFGTNPISYAQDQALESVKSEPSEAAQLPATAETPVPAEAEAGKAEEAIGAGKADKPDSERKAPRQVFNPTEEISEDSPVPFPVDI